MSTEGTSLADVTAAETLVQRLHRIGEEVCVNVARRWARDALIDWLGVTLRGQAEEAAELAHEFAREQFATGGCTVIGRQGLLSPAGAALVNGTGGHALDYDDAGLRVGHPTAPCVAAILAAAEVAQAELDSALVALVVAYEAVGRLGLLSSDPDAQMWGPGFNAEPTQRGFHTTSLYGVLGAAAGCSRILQLDIGTTVQALGVAASMSSGLMANFGTMTKPLHAGQANSAGFMSADLARRGFSSSRDFLEVKSGWLRAYTGKVPDVDEDAWLNDPRTIVEQERLMIKRYPFGSGNTLPVQALEEILKSESLRVSDISNLEVRVAPGSTSAWNAWPKTPLEGKFSLPFNVLTMLVHRRVGVDAYTAQNMAEIAPYRPLLDIRFDSSLQAPAARLRLTCTDGRTFEREACVVKGSPRQPLAAHEIDEKFMENAVAVIGSHAAREVIRICRSSEGAKVSTLMALLGRP